MLLERRQAQTAVVWLAAWLVSPVYGQAALTWHNDNFRTGQNLQETILTPANVKSFTFKKLFALGVDGKVDAQPFMSRDVLPGKAPKCVFATTEHDGVYGFDADTGVQLKQVSLIGANETARTSAVAPRAAYAGDRDHRPTPVIDLYSGRTAPFMWWQCFKIRRAEVIATIGCMRWT